MGDEWRPKLAAARGHRWHRPPLLAQLCGRARTSKSAAMRLVSVILILSQAQATSGTFIRRTSAASNSLHQQQASSSPRAARRIALQELNDSEHLSQLDPMEPCYLANNRASETLTISESTPVGTVVGELLVSRSLSAARSLCACVSFHASIKSARSSNAPLSLHSIRAIYAQMRQEGK